MTQPMRMRLRRLRGSDGNGYDAVTCRIHPYDLIFRRRHSGRRSAVSRTSQRSRLFSTCTETARIPNDSTEAGSSLIDECLSHHDVRK